ncbi:uncharacterized protein LOC121368244 isoform X2 [Gigantopelta aegis]|uniref:uncharacterized protein LOC121368244 isoform X2 n=1 Tax=Gigantopelta aegis TaxID=1735272 RepID=UPI001B88B08C|nr:uncharacterized protein LOC121368244 isoform X2 [Gigantopelta aegis]
MQNGKHSHLDNRDTSICELTAEVHGHVGKEEADHSSPVFEEHQKVVSDNLQNELSKVMLISSTSAKISDNYASIPYGIQLRCTYEHGKSESDIMGITYSGRMRQFIILDSKGLTTWKRQITGNEVIRTLSYPKYEYKLITYLVYAKKHNCYFALCKDFSVKVMNHEFVETCSISADMSSVLFLVFNPVRDELITGGVGGIKVWLFHQVTTKVFMEIKPLANFRLTLKYEIPNVGGSWVKRVDLNHHLEHLYCSSDTDLFVYDMQGKLLFTFARAHSMSITGCCYSLAAKVLVTASVDSEVKVWSLSGGLVHTFRGHSRAVTSLSIHPQNSAIAITSSLDGTIRLWSLEFMDALYSMVVSADGVLWMGLTDDQLLYLATARSITMWSLNYFFQFWSMAHNKVTSLSLVGSENKTTRVVATSSDSSVRLFARCSHKNMSTVLPPPSISPLQTVLNVCYSREFNVVFMLVNPRQIWVYTTRTDPACRIAIWDVHELQMLHFLQQTRNVSGTDKSLFRPSVSVINPSGPLVHRAVENCVGNEVISNCCCLSSINSSVMMWTEEGLACPIKHSYLLLGLEDGRILFMDPVIKGRKYMEFKASKNPIQEIKHDSVHKTLITVCKLKEQTLIEIWSLPELELQFEIYCASDVTGYARHGSYFMTGHESGNVIFYSLLIAPDTGLNKTKVMPEYNAVVDRDHRPEHNGPVITVDSCSVMGLFCSCSADGAIKIWECDMLVTEIMLEESLSSACFLTSAADLIVGFKEHIFYIDHSKVCPHLTCPEAGSETSDKESFVYEDPAVMYEGIVDNPDPINMESYLVPYEIEFTKDFLEGKLELNPLVQKHEEECDEEPDYLLAPTEVYLSPCDTPSHLSHIDLILDSEVTRFDLEKHMEQNQNKAAQKKKHQKLVDGKPTVVTFSGDETDECDGDTFTNFDFPAFGQSPGPSPTPSVVSLPQSVGSSPSSEISENSENDLNKKPSQFQPDTSVQQPVKSVETTPETSSIVKPQKPKVQASSIPTAKVEHHRLSNITIDVMNVMKNARKSHPLQKDADHTHIKNDDVVVEENKKNYYRDIKKKNLFTHRQLPKRGKKIVEETLSALDVSKTAEGVKQELTAEMGDTKTRTAVSSEMPLTLEDREKEAVSAISAQQMDWEMETPNLPVVAEKSENKTKHASASVATSSSEELRVGSVTRVCEVEQHAGATRVCEVEQHAGATRVCEVEQHAGATRVCEVEQHTGATRVCEVEPHPGVTSVIHHQELQGERNKTDGSPRLQMGDGDFQSASEQKVTEDKSVSHIYVEKHRSDTERKVEKQRPVSSFVDRGNNEIMGRLREQRPHTAAQYQFNKEELQMAYNSALHRYQSLPGIHLCPEKLYKNDGINFTDQWHERAIQRHMLIRMQKELRQYYATQKRHSEQQQHRERQQSLYGHAECSITPATQLDMSTYALRQLEKANTVVLSEPHIAVPNAVTPDCVHLYKTKSRPHTVNVAMLQRKKQLGSERNSQTPFRLRMNPKPPQATVKCYTADISAHLMDPRNPKAIRPKSSKSIPSKCSRYILVTKPKEKTSHPVPSPLEGQLMYKRFPTQGLKLARQYDIPILQNPRPLHAVQYSPFAQQTFN